MPQGSDAAELTENANQMSRCSGIARPCAATGPDFHQRGEDPYRRCMRWSTTRGSWEAANQEGDPVPRRAVAWPSTTSGQNASLLSGR